MSYRSLSIRIPPERDQYTGTERIPSYQPSPRSYDTITRKALTDLQQKNRDLIQKLKHHEEAPLLMKNLVNELTQSDVRVKELQTMLKIHAADDQKEARVKELRDSAKRVRSLQERIARANSKNREMEIQLKSKRKLEKKFNNAVQEMDTLLEKLAYAKYRSKVLEETLVHAREKQRELRTAQSQLRGMQNDLEEANRQLRQLGVALVNLHDQWEKRSRDVSAVRVDGNAVGQLKAERTDVHGRPTRDAVKVVELKNKGPKNTYATSDSYYHRSNKEVDLIRKVNELELTNKSIDKLSEGIKAENFKLAEEIQALMKIMQEKGITLTPEQMGAARPMSSQSFQPISGVQTTTGRPGSLQTVQVMAERPIGGRQAA